MVKYEVVPYYFYRHKSGKTASVHGACPWHSTAEQADWEHKQVGYTVYNPLTGQYGIGRAPWKTEAEAQAFADTHKPSRHAIGD